MDSISFLRYVLLLFPILGHCQKAARPSHSEIEGIAIYRNFMEGGTTSVVNYNFNTLANAQAALNPLNESDLMAFKMAIQGKPRRLLQQKYGLVHYGIVSMNGQQYRCIFSSNKSHLWMHNLTTMRKWKFKKMQIASIHELLQQYY